MLTGRTIPTPRTAAVMAVTHEGLDWLELLPSDDAQQLSAWACVRTRSDPERCESPLCIGHSPPSAQHAMRASGVGIHPAQIAAFPAIRANVSERAARRWMSLTTPLGCSTPEALSNDGFQTTRIRALAVPQIAAAHLDRARSNREVSRRINRGNHWTVRRGPGHLQPTATAVSAPPVHVH